jgi:hypothetical protein
MPYYLYIEINCMAFFAFTRRSVIAFRFCFHKNLHQSLLHVAFCGYPLNVVGGLVDCIGSNYLAWRHFAARPIFRVPS